MRFALLKYLRLSFDRRLLLQSRLHLLLLRGLRLDFARCRLLLAKRLAQLQVLRFFRLHGLRIVSLISFLRLIALKSFQCLLIKLADIFQEIEDGALNFGLYQAVRPAALLLLHLYRFDGRNGH